jgi:hypothetical protein
MKEDLDSLYDAFIRERSLESLLRLAAAVAKQTPGENNFAQERERIKRLFEDRIAELRRTEDTNQFTTEEFMRDKLYELRQWVSFLHHTYEGAKASSETAHQLRAYPIRASAACNRAAS